MIPSSLHNTLKSEKGRCFYPHFIYEENEAHINDGVPPEHGVRNTNLVLFKFVLACPKTKQICFGLSLLVFF